MKALDSHLHVWDLERCRYPWLGPQHGPLDRSFLPQEAARELAAAGVGSAVLVQAADSEDETRFLLEVAASQDHGLDVAGVVGWVRLDAREEAARQLAAYGGQLCGVRHLTHDDPRDDFFDVQEVRASLRDAAACGLALDVPDAWPRHLGRLGALADALPELTIVLDHLGKPPHGLPDAMVAWSASVRDLAQRGNVVAKLSGLQSGSAPLSVEAVRPAYDVALDCFGPERLMYGGDWPMTTPAGGYRTHWDVVVGLISTLSDAERAAVLSSTAAKTYGLS